MFTFVVTFIFVEASLVNKLGKDLEAAGLTGMERGSLRGSFFVNLYFVY